MLKALPVHHPEQLVQVNMAGRDISGIRGPFVSNPVQNVGTGMISLLGCSAMLSRGLIYQLAAKPIPCRENMYRASFSTPWDLAPK